MASSSVAKCDDDLASPLDARADFSDGPMHLDKRETR